MTYLESRHTGLQRQSSLKIAVNAEFNDWMQNKGDEDWFTVRGLPRLNVARQAWPDAARRQVADLIKLVLNTCRIRLDFEVISVFNPFSRTNTGPTLYNVKMDSVYSSEKIRDLFSGFFRHNRPLQLPSSLKGVEVRNKITLETKIRIAIMRQLGIRYQDSNPGSSFKVRGYSSRPTLVTTPPRSSTEKQRTYNFIQAVTTLPASFTDENLAPIFQNVGDRFRGKLQSLFIVLNDDDHDRCLELARNHSRVPRRGQASGPATGTGPTSSTSTAVGHVHGRGAGMEVEARTLIRHDFESGAAPDLDLVSSLRSPPPPPPTHLSGQLIETELSRAHDHRVRQRREHERQPSPSPDRRGLKRRHQSSSPDYSRRSKRSGGRGKRSRRSRSRSRSRSSTGSASGSEASPSRSKKNHKSKHKK